MNSQQKALLKGDSYTVGFLSGGVASCMAEVLTLPLNTAKVRMMLYGWSGKYGSVQKTLSTIKKEQGFFALWNGLSPALFRQFIFSGIKLSIYDPIKTSLCSSNEEIINTPLFKKIAAGVISGGLA